MKKKSLSSIAKLSWLKWPSECLVGISPLTLNTIERLSWPE